MKQPKRISSPTSVSTTTSLIDANEKDKVPAGHARSTHWPRVRADHLSKFPKCALCAGSKTLEVHHIRPFHLHPELELDPQNLITLCECKEQGLNCHLAFGHLGSFKSFNADIERDAAQWQKKLTSRPVSG